MSQSLETLRQRHKEAQDAIVGFSDEISRRIIDGGAAMDEAERARLKEMQDRCDEARLDFDAQKQLEERAGLADVLSRQVEGEISEVRRQASETTEMVGRSVRDVLGADAHQAYIQRGAKQLEVFNQMSETGRSDQRLYLRPDLARNLANLREAGVSVGDYVEHIRAGHRLIQTRAGSAPAAPVVSPDERLWSMGVSAAGGALVPTYWDTALYLYASYIGGVQKAGAEVIPVMGNNTLKLPVVTAYGASGTDGKPLGVRAEGTAIPAADETQDRVSTVDLSPRPFRGIAAETDELRRSAAVDVRMDLVIRALARALQLGKEEQFHNGDGTTEPKGILDGTIPTSQQEKTGANTTPITYERLPKALARLDAEYFSNMRQGPTILTHSATYWGNLISATVSSTDQRPIFPMPMSNMPYNLFGCRIEWSHLLQKGTPTAANQFLAVIGNFMDAYVIATAGGVEIDVTDDARFTEWERLYRIQEYCDGKLRDNRALVWVQSGT